METPDSETTVTVVCRGDTALILSGRFLKSVYRAAMCEHPSLILIGTWKLQLQRINHLPAAPLKGSRWWGGKKRGLGVSQRLGHWEDAGGGEPGPPVGGEVRTRLMT